jgi:hypothetical protein
MTFRDVVIHLDVLMLYIQKDEQSSTGRIVPQAELDLARSGRCCPMDIPDGIARLIGTDAPDQERVGKKLLTSDKLTESPGNRQGDLLRIHKPGIYQHRSVFLLIGHEAEDAKHITGGQRSFTKVIGTPMKETDLMSAADLLIWKERKYTAIIHLPIHIQVIPLAKTDMRRDTALHTEPGDHEGCIVPYDLNQFPGLSLEYPCFGKLPVAG